MISPSRWRTVAMMLVVTVSSSTILLAQEGKTKKTEADRVQKGEGVIVRVEPVDESSNKDKKSDRKANRKVKLTINTAAVWRDYARDQATVSGKTDAKKGENSVATQGQPLAPESTIIAEVGPDSRVILRYRASTDETNEGSRTVQGAEKKDGSPESSEVKRRPRDEKAPKIGVTDLKPGLFVFVNARKGKASEIIVLKPVGGPQTPASEADPKK
ncbi:MAG: hypothetical protein JWN86_2817 [Planctomycetota bacterium]|nr:hypothetical protein [Planctomycetota bacterium]